MYFQDGRDFAKFGNALSLGKDFGPNGNSLGNLVGGVFLTRRKIATTRDTISLASFAIWLCLITLDFPCSSRALRIWSRPAVHLHLLARSASSPGFGIARSQPSVPGRWHLEGWPERPRYCS